MGFGGISATVTPDGFRTGSLFACAADAAIKWPTTKTTPPLNMRGVPTRLRMRCLEAAGRTTPPTRPWPGSRASCLWARLQLGLMLSTEYPSSPDLATLSAAAEWQDRGS